MTDIATTTREFRPPRTMTPGELGDNIALLVWESFTDFVADGDTEVPLSRLGVPHEEGMVDPHAAEEALIFLLWAHTRGVQLAFLGRSPEERVREGLDALHNAVFEDMVENGTPPAHLPIFEQRVSARYTTYNEAAERSDQELGAAVVRHLTREEVPNGALSRAISERAIAAAEPLRDFLADVELVA